VVLHEVAHRYVSLRYGDTTARDAGRLSLNPLGHVDPIGACLRHTVDPLFYLFVPR
jgi:Zn-dependent protease